jgi:hypothetical protein
LEDELASNILKPDHTYGQMICLAVSLVISMPHSPQISGTLDREVRRAAPRKQLRIDGRTFYEQFVKFGRTSDHACRLDTDGRREGMPVSSEDVIVITRLITPGKVMISGREEYITLVNRWNN